VVLVTAPDLKTARRLVQLALRERLVACGNIVQRLESHYWWQGKLESSAEVLILFKTKRATLPALEKLILSHHPYDTAEIISLAVDRGTKRYLQWLENSLAGK